MRWGNVWRIEGAWQLEAGFTRWWRSLVWYDHMYGYVEWYINTIDSVNSVNSINTIKTINSINSALEWMLMSEASIAEHSLD